MLHRPLSLIFLWALTLSVIENHALFAQGVDPLGKGMRQELDSLPIPVGTTPQATIDSVVSSLPAAVDTKAPPSYALTPDHRYVLYGDLFGNGHPYALVEMPSQTGLAFAAFNGGQWQIQGLWNIELTWRPKEWQSSGDDYLPTKPAEKPFELQDFNGDGVPEIIVAGEVAKYYQADYLFQFDSKTNTLHPLVTTKGKPKEKDGYLLLYFDSGHRAIWGETDFLQWQNGHLIQVASWHDETPYNDVDPEFVEVGVRKSDGTFENFHIENSVDTSKNQESFDVKKDGKKFATVVFTLKKTMGNVVDSESEEAWLFQHLTRLPFELYPASADQKPIPFEGQGKIEIMGDTVAKQRFKDH